MSVTSLRAGFGLLPAGDPYSPNIYAAIAAGNLPTNIFIKLPSGSIPVPPQLFLTGAPKALAARIIPTSSGNAGFADSACTDPSTLVSLPSTFASVGAPAVAIGAGVAGIALGPIGAAAGAGASLVASLISNGNQFGRALALQSAQFSKVVCSISATLTQLLSTLDSAVGTKQITAGQAKTVWDSYAAQAKYSLSLWKGTLYDWLSQIYSKLIDATTEFSENYFWNDLYPIASAVAPGQPVILTQTPAPANEFAATPAAPPAAIVPSIIQASINATKGSPSLGAPVLIGSGYGGGAPIPAQPLPVGVYPAVLPPLGGSALTPLLLVGAIVIAAVLIK